MIRLSFLIPILILSCSRTKEYPDKVAISKIINPILAKQFDSSVKADTTEKIRYIKGHFTKLNKEECLVILPKINTWGRTYICPTLLFEKTNKQWIYSNWNNLSSDSISVVELKSDKLFSIFLTYSTMATGRYIVNQTLISLIDNKETTLYHCESFDDSMERDPIVWKDKDTISAEYELQFRDMNNDGVKEIIEKKTLAFRDKVINDSLVEKYITNEKIIKLKINNAR